MSRMTFYLLNLSVLFVKRFFIFQNLIIMIIIIYKGKVIDNIAEFHGSA